jgi:hypothetical protein
VAVFSVTENTMRYNQMLAITMDFVLGNAKPDFGEGRI